MISRLRQRPKNLFAVQLILAQPRADPRIEKRQSVPRARFLRIIIDFLRLRKSPASLWIGIASLTRTCILVSATARCRVRIRASRYATIIDHRRAAPFSFPFSCGRRKINIKRREAPRRERRAGVRRFRFRFNCGYSKAFRDRQWKAHVASSRLASRAAVALRRVAPRRTPAIKVRAVPRARSPLRGARARAIKTCKI